jgi:hypothetical protein
LIRLLLLLLSLLLFDIGGMMLREMTVLFGEIF